LEELKEFGCENQQDCIADIDFHISGPEAKRQLALVPSFYQTVDTGTISKKPAPKPQPSLLLLFFYYNPLFVKTGFFLLIFYFKLFRHYF